MEKPIIQLNVPIHTQVTKLNKYSHQKKKAKI